MAHVKYFWDEEEDNVVREYDENNNTLASYTTEPTPYGSVLSQDRGGEKRYFQFDGQRNTAELTDESGLVTDTFRYSAFGDETQAVGATQCTYKYQGQCGFYTTRSSSDVRHRKYLSDYGRWTSLDPLSELLNDSRSPYCYALNCPTRVSDKSGLLSQVEMDPNPPFGGTVYPKLGDCGRFFNTSRWELSPTERLFGGFIIQFVTDTFKPETCKGTNPYPDCPLQEVWDNLPAPVNQKRCDNYWELWEVPVPSSSIDPSVLPDPNPKFYDTFAFPGYRAPSRGSVIRKGQAYFISRAHLSSSNLVKFRQYFKTGAEGAFEAHSLPSFCVLYEGINGFLNTLSSPPFSLVTFKKSKTVKTVTASWKCCPKPSETNVTVSIK